ncbi:elongation factor G [Falsiroseomonas bella]|uniref:Elongation factor G n=1 Tax=Falsiroseomonas bella TaxID=2184016 RepID=A0A317F9I5_9PROT|nr:elongation factor G [Falsiroseomonas bella]PWS34619.1 elongation factor G [Falsiroseomonas bella]
MSDISKHGPRCAALIGPYGSGKSALFDAMLAAAGQATRRATNGRAHVPGTEMRVAQTSFLGDVWTLLDCPGSIELGHISACALAVADIAVIVVEADPARAAMAAPSLRMVEEAGIPALVFVNKLDALGGPIRDSVAALQEHARRRLLLRQVPWREGERIVGYVDLITERAWRWRDGAASEPAPFPEAMRGREAEARAALAEALADADDSLLEAIVEDRTPDAVALYRPLHAEEAAGRADAVLLGAAEHAAGVRRLWKAMRHDAPDVVETAARHGVEAAGDALAQVFRTVQAGHAGRLSYVRLWRGSLRDGGSLGGQRVGGIWRFPGGEATKTAEAVAGEVVALGRLEAVATGDTLGGEAIAFPSPPAPTYALAIEPIDRKDEVKLAAALAKLVEEDPSLTVDQVAETGETVLRGQGEQHLRAAIERLSTAIRLETHRPQVPFRETIRREVRQHARLKRQTGGHGQFADVTIEVAPRPRGAGFSFVDRIVGGAIPRKFIPACGEAAEEAARKGPLGNPVVDIEVTLVDGGFHSVDSSDMAFATATRMAVQEALAKADPVVLEPVEHVTALVPAAFTPAAQRLLSGRRGQILGYAEVPDRPGWDQVEAMVPAAELHDLILELRGQTLGLGTFRHRFDHLAEGRLRQG